MHADQAWHSRMLCGYFSILADCWQHSCCQSCSRPLQEVERVSNQAKVLKGSRIAPAKRAIERRSKGTPHQIWPNNGFKVECVIVDCSLFEQVGIGNGILAVAAGEVVGSWAIDD